MWISPFKHLEKSNVQMMAIEMPSAKVLKTCMDVLDPSDIVVAFYGMAMAHTALLKAAMGVSQQGLLFNSSVGGKQKLGDKW